MPAWLAGLGMALSSLLVVLNASRLARELPALGGADHAAPLAQGPVATPVPTHPLEPA